MENVKATTLVKGPGATLQAGIVDVPIFTNLRSFPTTRGPTRPAACRGTPTTISEEENNIVLLNTNTRLLTEHPVMAAVETVAIKYFYMKI